MAAFISLWRKAAAVAEVWLHWGVLLIQSRELCLRHVCPLKFRPPLQPRYCPDPCNHNPANGPHPVLPHVLPRPPLHPEAAVLPLAQVWDPPVKGSVQLHLKRLCRGKCSVTPQLFSCWPGGCRTQDAKENDLFSPSSCCSMQSFPQSSLGASGGKKPPEGRWVIWSPTWASFPADKCVTWGFNDRLDHGLAPAFPRPSPVCLFGALLPEMCSLPFPKARACPCSVS